MSTCDLQGELRYRVGLRRFTLRFRSAPTSVGDPDTLSPATSVEDPRVRIDISREAGRLTVAVRPRTDITVLGIHLEHERAFRRGDRVLLNGYQSWTDSREFDLEESIPPFPPLIAPALRKMLRLDRYGDYNFVPRTKQHLHGFTYAYVRGGHERDIDFVGSLSEREGFTVFHFLPNENRVRVEKDCHGLALGRGGLWRAFHLHLHKGDEETVFSEYLNRTLDEAGLKASSSPPWSGWTSWYYHYTSITESIVRKNLDAFSRRRVPIDVFQIDDGWQEAVGDWMHVNHKFPSGLRALTEHIHAAGYRAGLWLAPFIAEAKSQLIADHPGWLLRDARDLPVPAGNSSLWSGDFFALDIYHPGVRDHLKRTFDMVLGDYGFDLVKLDFLYAACIVPRRDRTRGEVMTDGMDFLREIAGDKKILGCGVPLAPAFGRVDYCRIGPDVGYEWGNTLTKGTNYREGISTVAGLENALGRRHLHGRAFIHDPDVFFLRTLSFEGGPFDPITFLQELRHGHRKPLSERQRHTLFLLNNVFGGLVFTSDDIDDYGEREMALYLSSFPLREKSDVRASLIGPAPAFNDVGGFYAIRFRIGALCYLVLANLSEGSAARALEAPAFARDEEGRGRFFEAGEVVTLAPHASLCLLEEGGGDVALVGSEGHLFPGAEIEDFTVREGEISLRRSHVCQRPGRVLVRIPRGLSGYRVNGAHVEATRYAGREDLLVLSGADLPAGRLPPSTPHEGS